MTLIAAGSPVPNFTLKNSDAEDFTQDDLQGETTVLVFYPFAFSPVCTDQLTIYEASLDEMRGKGMTQIYGVSTDPTFSQTAFKDSLGVSIEQLSDFEPKGAAAKAFGAYFEPGGMTNRALVIVGPDGIVQYSHLAANPGELPPVDLLLEGLS
jgi:peroxiredoxin (alkyl hydroperoxide reductase subunit C)